VLALAVCQPTAGPAPDRAQAALPTLSVAVNGAGWDGRTLPDGQQCEREGGNGATPPLRVSGIPAGADTLVVAYNDLDYPPLSRDGGHGKIGFTLAPGATSASLPAVPGHSRQMPAGAFIEAHNRGYRKIGYVPPCSGGAGHRYVAIVTALRDGVRVAASGAVSIGRY
jgi:hypothetical protein